MKYGVLFFAATVLVTTGLHGEANKGSIKPPKGAHVLMHVKGEGVQIYTCTEAPDGRKWVLTGPDAKLLDSSGKVIGTHSTGPTWTLNDGGTVKGVRVASKPSSHAGSVEWLLLRAREGTPSGSLSNVAFIQRTKTHGGAAKPTGCHDAEDTGKTDRVPYSATYTFYSAK